MQAGLALQACVFADPSSGLAAHCVLLLDGEGRQVSRLGCASAILEADCQDLACAFTVNEVLEAVRKEFVDKKEEEDEIEEKKEEEEGGIPKGGDEAAEE